MECRRRRSPPSVANSLSDSNSDSNDGRSHLLQLELALDPIPKHAKMPPGFKGCGVPTTPVKEGDEVMEFNRSESALLTTIVMARSTVPVIKSLCFLTFAKPACRPALFYQSED